MTDDDEPILSYNQVDARDKTIAAAAFESGQRSRDDVVMCARALLLHLDRNPVSLRIYWFTQANRLSAALKAIEGIAP